MTSGVIMFMLLLDLSVKQRMGINETYQIEHNKKIY